jgi:hypothetical protein
MTGRHALLMLCLLVPAAPGGALAQSDRSPPQVDLKPLVPPVIPRELFPPNSVLTPGSVRDPQSYSSAPLYDPNQNQPTPGLRLTIPTR